MRHPFQKFVHGEHISLVLALLIGLIALLKGFILLLILSFYCLAISLVCHALISWNTHQQTIAGKQVLRALLLFLFATFLLFVL